MKKLLMLAAAFVLSAPAAQAQEASDPAQGETVSRRCVACHTFEEGGAHKVGPNLWGIMTRPVASAEGFNYSDDVKAAAEQVPEWTEEELIDYLADPTAWVREKTGNASARSKMTFKLPDEGQRRDVIAYLQTLQ